MTETNNLSVARLRDAYPYHDRIMGLARGIPRVPLARELGGVIVQGEPPSLTAIALRLDAAAFPLICARREDPLRLETIITCLDEAKVCVCDQDVRLVFDYSVPVVEPIAFRRRIGPEVLDLANRVTFEAMKGLSKDAYRSEKGTFAAWLRGIAWNLAPHIYRENHPHAPRERLMADLPDGVDEVCQSLEDKFDYLAEIERDLFELEYRRSFDSRYDPRSWRAIFGALAEAKPKTRAIVEMTHSERWTDIEIAACVKMSVNAMRIRRTRFYQNVERRYNGS